jgi:HEAT repeat protein
VSELRPERVEWTRAIVRALGELDDGSSAPELITLLSHTHTGVADAALAALRRMSRLEYPPQPALWQAWYDREAKWYDRERPRQRNALGGGRPAAALEALRAYSQHGWRRAQLAHDVCGAFSRREAPVRELACEVLGGLGSRAALPALVETLGDPTTTVATAAWRALQRITGAALPNDREVWSDYLAAPVRPVVVQAIARPPSRP